MCACADRTVRACGCAMLLAPPDADSQIDNLRLSDRQAADATRQSCRCTSAELATGKRMGSTEARKKPAKIAPGGLVMRAVMITGLRLPRLSEIGTTASTGAGADRTVRGRDLGRLNCSEIECLHRPPIDRTREFAPLHAAPTIENRTVAASMPVAGDRFP